MSFTASSRERARPALPLAGMVDVLFLLLIFFMTSSVFRQQQRTVEVSLPQAARQKSPERGEPAPFVATVTKKGKLYLGAREHTLESFRAALEKLRKEYPDRALVVRGDAKSHLEKVVRVIDVARAVGVSSVEIATERVKDRTEPGP